MKPEEVVLQFVAAVNKADVDGLAGLMTDNHVFVDSSGSRTTGREAMRDAWSLFFQTVQGYRINVEEIYSLDVKVVLTGLASGVYSTSGRPRASGFWSVPAAWRAVVKGDRIAVWQVFVNPEAMMEAVRVQGGL